MLCVSACCCRQGRQLTRLLRPAAGGVNLARSRMECGGSLAVSKPQHGMQLAWAECFLSEAAVAAAGSNIASDPTGLQQRQ